MNSDKSGHRSDPDAQVVKFVRAGNLTAFAGLVRKYQQAIYNHIYRMLNDHQRAEEITQDVFIRVHKKIKSFKGKSSFKTWLFKIAHNLGLNYCKKEKSNPTALVDNLDKIDDKIIQEASGVLDRVSETERNEMIKDCLKRLPTEAKTVVVLHLHQEMPFPEIAKITAMNESTAKRWWYEIALPQLYKCLKSKGVKR